MKPVSINDSEITEMRDMTEEEREKWCEDALKHLEEERASSIE